MNETKKLFVKLNKDNVEYGYSKEQLTNSFTNALKQIHSCFIILNEKHTKYAEENILTLSKSYDFVLILRAFKRFAFSIEDILQNPFTEKAVECIYGLLYELEKNNIEKYLATNITQEEKENFLKKVKMFDGYKNFILVFVKHLECYFRFYYENLRKKYYFCFDYLYDICYENKNLEKLNECLLKICNKHCKPLHKYVKLK